MNHLHFVAGWFEALAGTLYFVLVAGKSPSFRRRLVRGIGRHLVLRSGSWKVTFISSPAGSTATACAATEPNHPRIRGRRGRHRRRRHGLRRHRTQPPPHTGPPRPPSPPPPRPAPPPNAGTAYSGDPAGRADTAVAARPRPDAGTAYSGDPAGRADTAVAARPRPDAGTAYSGDPRGQGRPARTRHDLRQTRLMPS